MPIIVSEIKLNPGEPKEKAFEKAFSVLKIKHSEATDVSVSKISVDARKKENVFPTIIPNWDHSPRSGKRGTIFTNSTPQNFKKHCQQVLSGRSAFLSDTNLIFLKSWNEWGEGNYMEPDLKYGKKFIETLREVIDQEENK